MNSIKICILIAITLISFMYETSTAEEECPGSKTDDNTTSLVTHIEYDPQGIFMKLEIPGVGSPEVILKESRTAMQKGETQIIYANLFTNMIPVKAFIGTDYTFVQVSFMKIPFMEVNNIKMSDTIHPIMKDLERALDINNPNMINPFTDTIPVDQPLLSLGDYVVVTPKKISTPEDAKKVLQRIRILDSLIFCLYQGDRWGGEYYEKEWFDMPFITTYYQMKGSGSSALKVIDIPLAAILNYERVGGKVKTEVINLLLASLYERHKTERESDQWTILNTVVGVLVKSEKTEERSVFAVLETPHIITDWLTFSLLRTDHLEDGASSKRYLRLPLLGPVWSSWKEVDDSRWHHRPLPRLLFWNSPSIAK